MQKLRSFFLLQIIFTCSGVTMLTLASEDKTAASSCVCVWGGLIPPAVSLLVELELRGKDERRR